MQTLSLQEKVKKAQVDSCAFFLPILLQILLQISFSTVPNRLGLSLLPTPLL